MCEVHFADALPNGAQMAMPNALTAPFQVAFPGYELPGEAAAAERQRWSRAKEASLKRAADALGAKPLAPEECNCRGHH